MDGPGDEVQELLVEREAGPCPAPADTVQADQGGVAREPVERSNDYERVKLKYECKKLNNFRICDKISVKRQYNATHEKGYKTFSSPKHNLAKSQYVSEAANDRNRKNLHEVPSAQI